jgi:hypothetical protein
MDDQSNDRDFIATPGGLLDGLPGPGAVSSLPLFMDAKDIATIPGLPQHVYDDAVRYDQSVANNDGPGRYISGLDQVSLAPQGLNPSGLDLSAPARQSADNQSEPGDKYEQGAKAAEFFGKGIDWWNDQNRILGLHFGAEGPEMLEKYTGPIGNGLVAVENGLKAGGEIAKGAPVLPTIAGAGIKTGSTLGAAALGAEGGGALGTAILGPVGGVIGGVVGGVAGGVAPDLVYGNINNQQVGEAAGRILGNAGRSYDRYVIHNPYYDPRLMVP